MESATTTRAILSCSSVTSSDSAPANRDFRRTTNEQRTILPEPAQVRVAQCTVAGQGTDWEPYLRHQQAGMCRLFCWIHVFAPCVVFLFVCLLHSLLLSARPGKGQRGNGERGNEGTGNGRDKTDARLHVPMFALKSEE